MATTKIQAYFDRTLDENPLKIRSSQEFLDKIYRKIIENSIVRKIADPSKNMLKMANPLKIPLKISNRVKI